ncbi:uncharacterized protein F4822DRAFT_261104 [Hypoxylon trugodes]|uniref:uncharacterized protein n=1 Tax=Hypoxylon trugodes TaxID=326681 RepID=UPI00219BE935|nr:uncharacterized protein F4822DRAFT_261104 [Hypoxylon trugodes]KAI1388876.1 hypothetical protein F4822DRAFT_261104 [Hypoxylon trugodes]
MNPGNPQPRRRVRKCWICLAEVEATYEQQGANPTPTRQYIDEDGERFINPCICRGSVKWCHEHCLRTWMELNERAWRCSRCMHPYELEPISLAEWLKRPSAAFGLTNLIFLIAVFTLGFVGNLIIGIWLDPLGTMAGAGSHMAREAENPPSGHASLPGEGGWIEHFLRGICALGLLGFLVKFVTVSPWSWFNMRTGGLIASARAGTGPWRIEHTNLIFVIIGIFTFLSGVWKAARRWAEKAFGPVSRDVLNYPSPESDDEEN